MYTNLGKILFGSIPDCETIGKSNVSKTLDLDYSRERGGSVN